MKKILLMLKLKSNNGYFPWKNDHGIALLLVMWVIIILFVIVAEFSFTMRSELNITRNLKDDTECYYLAIAGVHTAFQELLGTYDNVFRDENGNLILEDKTKTQIKSVDENQKESIERLDVPPPIRTGISFGRGFFSYVINDENSKLNLNRIVGVNKRPGSPYQTLRNLLITSGLETGVQLDTIMDSILDWRDSNSEHRLNGAEDDWYESNYREQGFSHPYKAKNAPFNTVDELLMVRGMTKEILYGTARAREMSGESIASEDDSKDSDEPIYKGIYKYLSVFNIGRRINKNTASKDLLEAMYPETADEILQQRKEKNGRYNDRSLSSFYTIISTGYLPNSDTQHTVKVTVWRRGSRQNKSIQIQYWIDNEVNKTAPMVIEKNNEENP